MSHLRRKIKRYIDGQKRKRMLATNMPDAANNLIVGLGLGTEAYHSVMETLNKMQKDHQLVVMDGFLRRPTAQEVEILNLKAGHRQKGERKSSSRGNHVRLNRRHTVQMAYATR